MLVKGRLARLAPRGSACRGPSFHVGLSARSAGRDQETHFGLRRAGVDTYLGAGELVVAIESDTPVEATELDQQFARTPYAVSFETGSRGFTLVTLHVLYGEAPADRVDEPKEIATSLAEWPKREKEWSENLLALGDFNVDRRGEGLRPLVRTRAGGGALPVGDGSGQLEA
jgi:hypothetical protein